MPRKSVSIAAVAALLALGSITIATPAIAAEGDPTLELENTTFTEGSWGEGFTGVATGFDPGAAVIITVFRDDTATNMRLGYMAPLDLVADEFGNVSFEGVIPPSVPRLGGPSYLYVASRVAPAGQLVPEYVGIELTILEVPAPALALGWDCGAVGDNVEHVSAIITNLTAGEEISVAIVSEDGNPAAEDATAVASEDGTVELTLEGEIPAGIYTVTVTRSGGESLSESVTVGSCDAPAAAPGGSTTLAATGLDGGPLAIVTALLLLAGAAALIAARRSPTF